jgi:transposase
MRTIVRNVTHGFRSNGGRNVCATVRSVVNTGKRQGWSAFESFQRARSPFGSHFDLA